MRSFKRYIWQILTIFLLVNLILQIYQTNKYYHECRDIRQKSEDKVESPKITISRLSLYADLIDIFSYEHKIPKQDFIDFFTQNQFCYVKEVPLNDEFFNWWAAGCKDYILYDTVLELMETGVFFLFDKGVYVGSINVWSYNSKHELNWYLKYHELFLYD